MELRQNEKEVTENLVMLVSHKHSHNFFLFYWLFVPMSAHLKLHHVLLFNIAMCKYHGALVDEWPQHMPRSCSIPSLGQAGDYVFPVCLLINTVK